MHRPCVFLLVLEYKQYINLYTSVVMPHKKQESELNVKLKTGINETLTWRQFPSLALVNI